MAWETPASAAAAEALQERIWDIHDKLSHAILSLSLSACARRAAAPGCRRCRTSNGHVVVKGGGGDSGLAEAADVTDARGLHAIRAALEDLDGHLDFLHEVHLQQQAERDAMFSRLQQSLILLATRLAEHRGKRHGVIEEALAFVGDLLKKNQFVSPEGVDGMHCQSRENEEDPRELSSNMVVRMVSCSFALAKNVFRMERIGGVLGNATVFATSMLALLHLHQVAFSKHTPAVQYSRLDNHFYSGRSRKNNTEKHLEVLLARG